MSTLKQLLESIWLGAMHLRKKAYTAGMVVIAGAAAVAFMFIGVNGFTGHTDARVTIAYEAEEEDVLDESDSEILTEDIGSEESLIQPSVDTVIAYRASELDVAITTEDTQVTEILTKAPETEEDRSLKTTTEDDVMAGLSVRDYTALIRIVEAEATDEDLKGKILIANVVLNRVASGRFPNSIYDVVHQELGGKAQFSPIDDGRYYTVRITSSTEQAVAAALKGTDYSGGALFFVAKSLASESAASWFDRNLNFVMTYGVHSFYKY